MRNAPGTPAASGPITVRPTKHRQTRELDAAPSLSWLTRSPAHGPQRTPALSFVSQALHSALPPLSSHPPWPVVSTLAVRPILHLVNSFIAHCLLCCPELPPDARADDVSKFFDGHGRIVDCRVMTGWSVCTSDLEHSSLRVIRLRLRRIRELPGC